MKKILRNGLMLFVGTMGLVSAVSAQTFAPRVSLSGVAKNVYDPFSLIASDIDKDGKAELIIGNFENALVSSNSSNSSALSFSAFASFKTMSPTALSIEGSRVADFNGDKKNDLITFNGGSNNPSTGKWDGSVPAKFSVFIGNGTSATDGGYFETTPSLVDTLRGGGANAYVVADFNADGLADFLWINGYGIDPGNKVYLSYYTNATTSPSQVKFTYVRKTPVNVDLQFVVMKAVDIDNDGDLDVLAGGNYNGAVFLFKNNTAKSGVLTFADPVEFTNYIKNGATGIRDSRPNSDGFSDNFVYEDFNGDGLKDVIQLDKNNLSLGISKNTGTANSPKFKVQWDDLFVSSAVQQDIVAADFNRDGKKDIAIAYKNSSEIEIYNNISTSDSIAFDFINITYAALPNATTDNVKQIVASDFDGDGAVDLAVSSQNDDMVAVFKNTSPIATATTSASVATSIAVYPNPAKDMITISGDMVNGTVSIMNTLGQVVLEQNVTASSASVNISTLTKGVYTVKMISADKFASKTISIE